MDVNCYTSSSATGDSKRCQPVQIIGPVDTVHTARAGAVAVQSECSDSARAEGAALVRPGSEVRAQVEQGDAQAVGSVIQYAEDEHDLAQHERGAAVDGDGMFVEAGEDADR